MKVKVQQTDLNFALNIVSKAINSTNALPILNNILISAKNDKLFFFATNLEISIDLNINAKVEEEGSITVPAKILFNYISLIPKQTVSLEILADQSLELKTKNSQTKIKGLNPDDYPTKPPFEEDYSFKINSNILKEALTETIFSSSLSSSRAMLSGVFFNFINNTLHLVATDSHRLAEKIILINENITDKNFLVPSKTLMELEKMLLLFEKESVKISVSKNQIKFIFKEVEVTSKLIESNFPDYKKIIPNEYKTFIKINSENLLLALKRVALFTKENNNTVYLEFNKETKKIKLFTQETKIGEEESEFDIEITGENNKIALNSQYILDFLNLKEGQHIIMEVSESPLPVKLSFEKIKDYIYIIMPLRF